MGLGEKADPLENPTTKRQFHLNSVRYTKASRAAVVKEWWMAGLWAGLSMVRVTNKQNLKVFIPPSSYGCGRTCRLGAFLAFSFSSLLCFSTLIPMSSPSQSSIVCIQVFSLNFFYAGCFFCPHCVCRAHTAQFYAFSRTKKKQTTRKEDEKEL